MPHYVYILKSLKDGKYYIGESANVEERIAFHNAGRQRSTKSRIPFELILIETFQTRLEALRREKEIKKWKGGNKFHNLISMT